MSRFSNIGVMGAGAWGTALAQVATTSGHKVVLMAREAEVYETINTRHTNDLFLKDVPISRDITAVNDMAGLSECDLVLAVAPAQHMRASLEAFKPHMRSGATIVLCSKGVERGSDMLMHHVLKDVLPEAKSAVLAGPSFASEVARGLPAAVTVACEDEALAEDIACALAGPTFRPYLSHDMVGAEAGGAIKNVLAIACGISEGRGLGKNAHAALITRGFAEMSRLAVALGAQYETMAGLCGLGDLVLTCSSTQSRNMSVGMAMGQGKTLAEALEGKLSVAEGVQSAPAVTHLGKALGVDLPICNAVNAVLNGDITVDEAINLLMTRPIKAERH